MTERLSRIAAIVVLLFGVGFVWAGALAPLTEWRASQLTRVQSAQVEKAKLEASVLKLTTERDAFGEGENAGLVWIAEQQGEAYARVQARLTDAASQAGIRFRAMTPIQSGRETNDTAVVRVEFEADLTQLGRFLRDIEYARPALPVERATIRRLVRPNDRSVQPVVFTQIDVAAPLLIGEGS